MREYDEIFEWYAKDRRPEVGQAEIQAFANALPSGAQVLDIGCGTGIPVSRFLFEQGCEIYGVDSSPKMIAAFRENLPAARVECAQIQQSDLFGMTFDGAVSWGVLFHLAAPDQEAALAKVANALRPRGLFLFTSGEEQGEVDGQMHGVDFHYVSLGAQRYESVLYENGMELLDLHKDKWDNSYYLAKKR